MKAADYGLHTPTVSAFVSTNSICQGQQVPILWPVIFRTGHQIRLCSYVVQVEESGQPQCGRDRGHRGLQQSSPCASCLAEDGETGGQGSGEYQRLSGRRAECVVKNLHDLQISDTRNVFWQHATEMAAIFLIKVKRRRSLNLTQRPEKNAFYSPDYGQLSSIRVYSVTALDQRRRLGTRATLILFSERQKSNENVCSSLASRAQFWRRNLAQRFLIRFRVQPWVRFKDQQSLSQVSSENSRIFTRLDPFWNDSIITNSELRPLRRTALEHGADRLSPASGLDRRCLRQD